MTGATSEDVARRFLACIEAQDFESWALLLAEEAVMEIPFAPHGMSRISSGREECRRTIESVFDFIESFQWQDVELHAGADPELVFGTARSRAIIRPDHRYANHYSLIFQIRGGQVVRYREFFDPTPVIEVFGSISTTQS